MCVCNAPMIRGLEEALIDLCISRIWRNLYSSIINVPCVQSDFVVFLTVLKRVWYTGCINFGFIFNTSLGNSKFKVFKLGEVLTHDLGSSTKPRLILSHGKLLYHVLIFMGLRFVLDEVHLLLSKWCDTIT